MLRRVFFAAWAGVSLAINVVPLFAREAEVLELPRRSEVTAVLTAAQSGERLDVTARRLRIVLLADSKDHGPGEHDYPRWQARWALLLGGKSASTEVAANLAGPDRPDPALVAGAQNVHVSRAQGWPSADQWESADLVVAFCYLAWNEERLAEVRKFLERGGGLVLIHSATWTRPGPLQEVADLTGVGGFVRYRHGPIELRISQVEHPICRGMPPVIRLDDESYWPPTPPSDAHRWQVLAVSEEAAEDGPAQDVATHDSQKAPLLPRIEQPMFWTYERGQGRVFGCVLGHNNATFDHPYFRLLLLRGMAWAAHEDPRRFDPQVMLSASVSDD